MSDDQEAKGRHIREEVRTTATPEAAYAAWADPEELAKWFVDRARGEARIGEVMTWVWESFGVEVPYRVIDADPPRRLVLGTDADAAPPGIIEITIARSGGDTVITVVNSGFAAGGEWDEMYEGIRSGWQLTLALLRVYLERYAGRARRVFLHMRPADVDMTSIRSWFTDEERLVQWLTRSGAPSPTGECDLMLYDGSAVRVEEIVRTDRETALLLPDLETVLELKTFATGREPDAADDEDAANHMIAMRGTCWGTDERMFERIRDLAEQSLERLSRALRTVHLGGVPSGRTASNPIKD